jgi:hypothetical protein
MQQLNKRFVVLFSLVASAGCGAAQVNETERRLASSSLHDAEIEGASQHPWPARLLAFARREMMAAERASSNGDESNSRLLLERARTDAELARQLTRTWHEQEKARVAWSKLDNDEPFGPDRHIDQEYRERGGAL